MDLGLEGKTAAVAAASAGLGLSSAKALAAAGVRVAICGRDNDRLQAAAAQIQGDVFPLLADVGTAEGAAAFIADADAHLGSVDIVIANCGGPPPGTFANTSIDAYRQANDVAMLGSIAMSRAAIPAMQARGWGRVVAITSYGVRQPPPMLIASATARAGLTAFLKITAREVARNGVTVNSVQPGAHDTARLRSGNADMTKLAAGLPTGVIGDADDFGQAVAFLCSQQARFITGAALLIDGGASLGV
ncbi:MAG: 3-oxoacyl-[acyl-carrier protein] reductase [Chloroflexi bacterium]|nr:MAG: 3-oxoacyl-[acyl-carrier protein] reductase [Chloroflexota bacterium]